MKRLDLANQKFGRLTALSMNPERFNGRIFWNCICECGNKKVVSAKSLRNADTQSCGCLFIETSIKKVYKKTELGHKRINSKGYILIKTVDGYVQEHRYIMEQHIGRKLNIDEAVHHIDHNKQNNELSNLQLMNHGEHTALHNQERNKKWHH